VVVVVLLLVGSAHLGVQQPANGLLHASTRSYAGCYGPDLPAVFAGAVPFLVGWVGMFVGLFVCGLLFLSR
jgi:hypothetical protein